MSEHFVVKTENGYVGRMDLESDLKDTMRYDFAYTYSKADAETIAAKFNGTVVPTR